MLHTAFLGMITCLISPTSLAFIQSPATVFLESNPDSEMTVQYWTSFFFVHHCIPLDLWALTVTGLYHIGS